VHWQNTWLIKHLQTGTTIIFSWFFDFFAERRCGKIADVATFMYGIRKSINPGIYLVKEVLHCQPKFLA